MHRFHEVLFPTEHIITSSSPHHPINLHIQSPRAYGIRWHRGVKCVEGVALTRAYHEITGLTMCMLTWFAFVLSRSAHFFVVVVCCKKIKNLSLPTSVMFSSGKQLMAHFLFVLTHLATDAKVKCYTCVFSLKSTYKLMLFLKGCAENERARFRLQAGIWRAQVSAARLSSTCLRTREPGTRPF